MNKKKNIITLIIVACVMLVLAACGGNNNNNNDGGNNNNNNDGGKENTNASGGSSDEEITIKYWSMWNTGEPQQEVIQEIIDAYEAENDNVTIDVQWMGRQVLSDVRNAALGDDAPDLTDQSGAEVMGTLFKNDLAEPLDDLLSMEIPGEDGKLEDIFIDETLSFYQKDDNTYLIPYEIITSGFHFDKTLFDEHSIDVPTTWDEFVAVGKQLHEAGIAPLAQDGNIDFYNAYYFYWLSERILGNGALLEAAADETGETWLEPGYLEAAEKIEELVDNDFFAKGYDGSQYPAAQTSWAQGNAGMILNGSWLSTETAEYSSDDFEYDAFPFPNVTDNDKGADQEELYLIGWVAPKGANVDAVQDFLAFAMQKEFQEKIVTDTGNISTRADLDAPEKLEALKDLVVNAESFHPEYDGLQAEHPEWWKTVFLPLDDKLIFGEITADEFIEELQVQTKDFWDKQ